MAGKPRVFATNVRLPLLSRPHDHELSPLAPDNPYSIFNMVPPKMQKALEALDKSLLTNSERNLRRNCNPTPEVCRLRINLWDAYNKTLDTGGSSIPITEIIKGACSQDLFEKVILTNPNTLAYVAVPPADYQLMMRDLLDLGWDRLREALEEPIHKDRMVRVGKTKDGDIEYKKMTEINIPLVAEIRAIVQMLDLRVKGAILQKVQVQSHNITQTLNSGESASFNDATLEQLEAMERRVKKLTRGIELATGGLSIGVPEETDSEDIEVESRPSDIASGQAETGIPDTEDPPEET